MANAFTDRWIKNRREEEIPISPLLPPPSILDWLRQPIQAGPQRAPLWDPSKPGLSGMGNLPAGIINNSPLPMIARGLTKVGELEHKAYDWATTPEGASVMQNGGGVPTSPPFKAALTNAPGGAASSLAASPSGGPGYQAGQPAASFYRPIVKGMESGDYGQLHPITESGDRAYGAYGVMGANIPEWTYNALGQNMTPEEFLASPEAQDAVFDYQFGSYLAKGSPQDAAARWFSGRPLAESYGDKDILGTSTEAYVNNFNRRLGEDPLPPSVQPYQVGAAPQMPNPVDAPLPSQPDFSQVNQLVNQAAPQQRATPDRFTKMLSALASANANSDTRGPGAVSQLFANWGAGLSSGAEAADVERVNAENEFQERQRDFLLRRAEIASSQEGQLRSWKDASGDTGFRNRSADQAASFQNEQNAYTIGEANKKMGFEAGQENRQNLYDWQKQEIAQGKPTVVSSSKDHVTWQNPDGSFQSQALGANRLWDGYKEPDVPDPLLQADKYTRMQEQALQTGDLTPMKEEILRDMVKDGKAAHVFGVDNYDQLLEEATAAVDPLLVGTDDYLPAVQNAVTARLLQMTLGSDEWIPNAAAMGNPGAAMILQWSGGQ